MTPRASAQAASRPPRPAEPLAGLGWNWLLVFLAWLTLFWAVLILLDSAAHGPIGFDYLPVAVGVVFLVVAWPALRVQRRMQVAIEGLRDGAALDGTGDLDAFDRRLRRAVRRSMLASGMAIALTMGGYIAWAYRLGRLDQIEGMAGGEVGLFALMVSVCVIAGAVAGYLLGSLFGHGRLLTIMRDTGVSVTGFDTPQAQRAIHRIEDILLYSLVATGCMCLWFTPWFTIWFLGWTDDYLTAWGALFLVLWTISLGFYLVAACLPAIAFRRQIADLRGGPGAEAARRRQLAEARSDLDRIAAEPETRETNIVRAELEAFVARLEKQHPPRLPPPWLLLGFFLLMTAMLAASVDFYVRRVLPTAALEVGTSVLGDSEAGGRA